MMPLGGTLIALQVKASPDKKCGHFQNLSIGGMPIVIDPAEFIALQTIVMTIIGMMAAQSKQLGGIPEQTLIDTMAIACTDAIRNAQIDLPDSERIRRDAMDHVNHMLGGIRFPSDGAQMN
jgi:hypothetical protein